MHAYEEPPRQSQIKLPHVVANRGRTKSSTSLVANQSFSLEELDAEAPLNPLVVAKLQANQTDTNVRYQVRQRIEAARRLKMANHNHTFTDED